MLMKIKELAQLMKDEKILHCEVQGLETVNDLGLTKNFGIKMTIDPQSLYQPEKMIEQDIAEKTNDDYDEFLFQTKKLKEAKLRAELENL